MFEFLTFVVVAAALVAGVVYAQRTRREAQAALPPRRHRMEDTAGPQVTGTDERMTVTLPFGPVDPEAPTVDRMVAQAADQVMRQHPEVQRVEVRDRTGAVLGEILRPEKAARDVALPSDLSDVQPQRSSAPSPVRTPGPSHPSRVEDTGDLEAPHRSLVDRFELPASVRSQLADDPSLEDVLEAILRAAGRAPERDEDLLLVEDTAIVALHGTGKDAMNHAYRRYDASPALTGLAVTAGYLNPQEVTRRELLAPDLRYVGPDAIQRMADAVALGADPLSFALGMPLLG